jgi:hypothetical protein
VGLVGLLVVIVGAFTYATAERMGPACAGGRLRRGARAHWGRACGSGDPHHGEEVSRWDGQKRAWSRRRRRASPSL